MEAALPLPPVSSNPPALAGGGVADASTSSDGVSIQDLSALPRASLNEAQRVPQPTSVQSTGTHGPDTPPAAVHLPFDAIPINRILPNSRVTAPLILTLPSPAVAAMKAAAALKEHDSLRYAALNQKLKGSKSKAAQRLQSVLNGPAICANGTQTKSVQTCEPMETLPLANSPHISPIYLATDPPKIKRPDAWSRHSAGMKHANIIRPSASASEDSLFPSKHIMQRTRRDLATFCNRRLERQRLSKEIIPDGHRIREEIADASLDRKGHRSNAAAIAQVDEKMADELLLSLAECEVEEASLEVLVEITKYIEANPVAVCEILFDRGGIAILIFVLEKFCDNPHIQARACNILKLMGQSNALALRVLFEQNAIVQILKSADVIYRAGFDASSKRKIQETSQKETGQLLKPAVPAATTDAVTATSGDSRNTAAVFARICESNFSPDATEALLVQSDVDTRGIARRACAAIRATHTMLAMRALHPRSSGEKRDDEDLEDVVRGVVAATKQMVPCETVLVHMVDGENNALFGFDVDPNKSQMEKKVARDRKFPLDSDAAGIAGYACKLGKSVNIKHSAGENPKFSISVDGRNTNSEVSSLLCIPMLDMNGKVLGALEVINKQQSPAVGIGYFDHADQFLLRHMASQLADLISTKQLSEKLVLTEKKLNSIITCAEMLQNYTSLETAMSTRIRDLFLADRCGLFLRDSESLKVYVQTNESIAEIKVPVHAGIAGHTFQTGEIVNVANAPKDPRFNPNVDRETGYNTHSLLSAPLRNESGTETFGVLQMLNKASGLFSSEDELLIKYFASQAATSIHRAKLSQACTSLIRGTANSDHFISLLLAKVKNIVITVDAQGCVRSVNRAMDLGIANLDAFSSSAMRGKEQKMLRDLLGSGASAMRLLDDVEAVMAGNDWSMSRTATDVLLNIGGDSATEMVVDYQVLAAREVDVHTGIETKLGLVMIEDTTVSKRALRCLGSYITPEVANQVVSDGGVKFCGQRTKATILHAQVPEYENLCETLDNAILMTWLNNLIGCLSNDVTRQSGVLDKFNQGGATAVFGASKDPERGSYNACECAMKVLTDVRQLNTLVTATGRPGLTVAIGLSSGVIFSALAGTEHRVETVTSGETIGVAKMLQELCSVYNCPIIVTEAVSKDANADFHFRELDTIKLKGREAAPPRTAEPLKIFSLYERKSGERSDQLTEALELYAKGLVLLRRRQFKTALEFFENALSVFPEDGPSKTMTERCKSFLEKPPQTSDWDGTFHV
ncbi:hypothetical protein HDU82_006673 [Entophlyctis luteolus]|nr:hypothetical protein HDU82_006673 [Entophlyctis luteolus]